ncbi:MAG: hypothetical protein JNN08_10370 [Bryobacterales bacterium]|nr:hypothetical protein [Bryobacterales bacterium]
MSYPVRRSPEPAREFDALEYVVYLRRRWLFVAVACVSAGLAATVGSLLLPRRYTSTSSILIEPPAGTDPRTLTAISPIYLESLKTYELLATSDSLFAKAAERFGLRRGADREPIETLKSRVLKATKPRDTKLLQISVTLEKPETSQAMAQFLAEETVRLSSELGQDAGKELIEEAQRQWNEMRTQLEAAESAHAKATRDIPVQSLEGEVESLLRLLGRVKRRQSTADAVVAEQVGLKGESAARARAGEFARQVRELEQQIAAKNRLLAERTARAEETKTRVDAAQTALAATAKRIQDLRASLGSSGDRLRVIDKGIVPERPSEPRTVLHATVAVGLALLGSMVYLSLGFSTKRRPS